MASIEQGRTLSDGKTYRADFMGAGSGYAVFQFSSDADAWIWRFRVYPDDETERGIIEAITDVLWRKAKTAGEEED